MIDLYWTELSFGISVFFNFLLFSFLLLFCGKYIHRSCFDRRGLDIPLIAMGLLMIIIMTPLNGDDWFSYQEAVWKYNPSIGMENAEPIYGHIIHAVNRNYLLFRIVVWGGAFLFCCLAFKRYEININVGAFILVSAFLMQFNYARVSLAMSSYFLGLSFLINPMHKKRCWSILLAGVFFWGAFSFHRSLLPVILLSFFAVIPIEKPYLFILACLVIPTFATIVSSNGFFMDQLGDEYLSHKIAVYNNREDSVGGASIWGIIRIVLTYAAFFVPIVINSLIIFKNKEVVGRHILRLYRVMIGILFLAASFLFMGFLNFVFSFRYLYMTFIPLIVLTVYLYRERLMPRNHFSLIVFTGFSCNAFHFLYGLYLCI